MKLNGKLTLGENIADNGGLRIALMAYLALGRRGQPPDARRLHARAAVLPRLGQIWCENRRPEFARLQAQTDPHSPGRYRVNGVVSNMPEFQKAFSCKAGAPMVRGRRLPGLVTGWIWSLSHLVIWSIAGGRLGQSMISPMTR